MTGQASWHSASAAIATIDSAGKATAVGKGTTQISATYGGMTSSQTLTVSAATAVSLAVSPSNTSAPAGTTSQFTATATLSDNSTQDVTSAATWSSSSNAIATVNNAGLAQAVAQGQATISASYQSVTSSGTLQVTPPELVGIAVSPTSSTVAKGATYQFSATGTYTDGSTQDVTQIVNWAISDTAIATVDGTGLVSGVDYGNTQLSASSNSINAGATVIVIPGADVTVSYFSSANTPGAPDGTLRISPTMITNGSICALVYVFAADQQLSECCGCAVSENGLLVLSLDSNLTANPLTGSFVQSGVVKVVPVDMRSDVNCDPSTGDPNYGVQAWGTHIGPVGPNAWSVTESTASHSPLMTDDIQAMQSQCGFIQSNGSGSGICSCGPTAP